MFSITKKLFNPNVLRSNLIISQTARLHSTKAPSLTDMPDVFKVDYTEEFDQGLTDE